MAIGEIGTFLPAESAYGTPGAYSQALRAEATKRASYLSEMDQFYAQLEESQRQFNESLAFQEESWEEEFGLKKEELAYQRKLSLGQLLLGLVQAKIQRSAVTKSGEGAYLGRDKELEFLKKQLKPPNAAKGVAKDVDYSPRYGKDYDPYERSWYLGDKNEDLGYPGYGF